MVIRPRLTGRLNEGLHRIPGVTLISAPAGFGKTTLVSEWVESIGRPTAWLSLDEGDSDPTRFLTYLVAALQTVTANIGSGVLDLLQSPQPSLPESIFTTLLNEIATVPDNFVLVLEDYHVIDAQPIDKSLAFLIEHLPLQMHLVITTREDPHLPLARLRARGQLTELRAAELRFTAAEAAEFLNRVMGLSLSATDIAALEDRTEGWIAGLQLAALSMQSHQDIHEFIKTFTGDNRYVVDYLVEEVLQCQPEPIRSFLLHTAILNRLNGPLCDAVTNQEGGKARLETLERGNFFVVPLDDKRQWYSYHHLFAEVLQAYLRAEQPALVSTLHRRASQWYEQHGLADDAIRHALAAEDFERAADLVELAMPFMRQSRQEATVLGWLKALPDALVRVRPVLSVGYAWVLLAGDELEGIEGRLRDAEQWLDSRLNAERNTGSSAVAVDEEEIRRLPGLIAIYRAGRALKRGDLPGAVKYAQQSLDLSPEDDPLWQGAAAALLGLASWASGDLEVAHRMYATGMASVQKAGNISDAISGAIARADIRIAQGRLREAINIYDRALQLATEQEPKGFPPVLRGTADLYVGMSELHREHNDLNAATQHLLRSKELGEQTGLPQNRSRWSVAMARVREAQGDLDGALDLLYEAERLYVSDFFPNVRPVAALKARVWVAQGRLGEALAWVREQSLSAHDDLSYLHEFEHITLARVLLARYKSERTEHSLAEVVGLLARFLQAAEAGGRTGSVIEILVLQALTHQAQGDIPAALVPLQRALALAESEGYVRLFVDEGSPMAQLLLEAAGSTGGPGRVPDYAGKVLAAYEAKQQMSASKPPLPTAPIPTSSAAQSLIEPLSQRELEVLRLFKTELSGPEIARELVIGLSTVRTHTKSIYSKLNVSSRRAAVKRAVELDLI